MEIWRGQDANISAAQQALVHRADCDRVARRGEYTEAVETSPFHTLRPEEVRSVAAFVGDGAILPQVLTGSSDEAHWNGSR